MSNTDWLTPLHQKHTRLTLTIVDMLNKLLERKSIKVLNVSGRTKAVEGIQEKIRRKNYRDPKVELTDLTGIRVITFFNSQIDEVCALMEEEFEIDRENSLDKASALGVDRIGYRSVHYVCKLKSDRISLAEYGDFANLNFEVQIRTILQHAWAELAHDRTYKFSARLPEDIERRLNLYAGLLEIADGGFDSITKEIAIYTSDLQKRTEKGELDIEINSLSLEKYAADHLGAFSLEEVDRIEGIAGDTIDELKRFGIKTFKELDLLLSPEFISAYKKHMEASTSFGFLRDAMMFEDLDKYFNNAWDRDWTGTEYSTLSLLSERYEKSKIHQVFDAKGVQFVNDDDAQWIEEPWTVSE